MPETINWIDIVLVVAVALWILLSRSNRALFLETILHPRTKSIIEEDASGTISIRHPGQPPKQSS